MSETFDPKAATLDDAIKLAVRALLASRCHERHEELRLLAESILLALNTTKKGDA